MFNKKCFINLRTTRLALFLFLLVLPLLLIIWIIFGLFYRQLVIILAKIFKRGALEKILTVRSSLLTVDEIYKETRNSLFVALLLEGVVDMPELRVMAQKKILELKDSKTGKLRYPELQQNIRDWMGFPFFKNVKNIDLNHIIREYEHNGNESIDNEEALKFVKKISFEPFSKDHPLWEMIVFPNYKPDATKTVVCADKKYSALIFRIHHGVADGFSLLRLLQAFSNSADKFKFVETIDYTKQSAIKGKPFWSRILANASLAVKIPWEVAQTLQKQIDLDRWTTLEQKNKQLLKRNNTLEENKLSKYLERFVCGSSPNLPLTLISEIKVIHGVSGTAVLYAAIAGALRKIVFHDDVPSTVGLSIALPLPWADGKLRNEVTGCIIYLPMKEEDPVKRLHEINKRLEEQKLSTIPIFVAYLGKIWGSMPNFIKIISVRISYKLNNAGLSNVAGPREGNDFAGYPIKDLLVGIGAPVCSKGILLSLVSIGGNIRVSIAADKKILLSDEKAQKFTLQFQKELEILKNSGNEFNIL